MWCVIVCNVLLVSLNLNFTVFSLAAIFTLSLSQMVKC